TRVGFPLFWYFHDSVNDATAHSLLPFYFHRRSPEESATAAGVLPLWFYHRQFSDGGGSVGLFPLAFFGHRGDRRHSVVLPLFFNFKDQRPTTTPLIPLFYHLADNTHTATGVPPLLYFQGHDHQDSYKIQVPLFWRFNDGRRGISTTVVPPIF